MVCKARLEDAISTHAPRTGSDQFGNSDVRQWKNFNPRSPHGERRVLCDLLLHVVPFQPTLPARGATRPRDILELFFTHFNPRSPHGERPYFRRNGIRRTHISTHAPRTGSDVSTKFEEVSSCPFQPTLPARGATFAAPKTATAEQFQPTLPARGTTMRRQSCADYKQFQPTLPARGATRPSAARLRVIDYFNPRSPHGERRRGAAQSCVPQNFNPRSPHGERLPSLYAPMDT